MANFRALTFAESHIALLLYFWSWRLSTN